MTSHTYDEETAWAIWENIKEKHIKALEDFAAEINVRIRATNEDE